MFNNSNKLKSKNILKGGEDMLKAIEKKDKGFTLVELLIVIAIIAVLAGAVLIVINPATLLAEGRDSQRLQDMDSLNKSLTLALADGEIQLTTTTGVCATCTSSTANPRQSVNGTDGWIKFTIPTGKTGLGTFISTLPTDPSTNTYSFASDATAQTFELNAVLEAADNSVKMQTDGGNEPGVYEIGTDPALDLIGGS